MFEQIDDFKITKQRFKLLEKQYILTHTRTHTHTHTHTHKEKQKKNLFQLVHEVVSPCLASRHVFPNIQGFLKYEYNILTKHDLGASRPQKKE